MAQEKVECITCGRDGVEVTNGFLRSHRVRRQANAPWCDGSGRSVQFNRPATPIETNPLS